MGQAGADPAGDTEVNRPQPCPLPGWGQHRSCPRCTSHGARAARRGGEWRGCRPRACRCSDHIPLGAGALESLLPGFPWSGDLTGSRVTGVGDGEGHAVELPGQDTRRGVGAGGSFRAGPQRVPAENRSTGVHSQPSMCQWHDPGDVPSPPGPSVSSSVKWVSAHVGLSAGRHE